MSVLRGLRVLIVDDEAVIALYAEDILSELGAIPVATAGTVAEAMAAIAAQDVDAVLLDVNLRGTSSEPVARSLHAKQIPFVVATGHGSVKWHGIDPLVIHKPYNRHELQSSLESVCRGREDARG